MDIHPLDSDHPNAICLRLKGEADRLTEVIGTSEGGGSVLVSQVDSARTRPDGEPHHLLIWLKDPTGAGRADELISGAKKVCGDGHLLTLLVSGEILRTSQAVHRYREVPPVIPAPEKRAADRPLFSIVAAHCRPSVCTAAGLRIIGNCTTDECPPLDILIVPGGPGRA